MTDNSCMTRSGQIFNPATDFSVNWIFDRKNGQVAVFLRDGSGHRVSKSVVSAAGVGDAERIADQILDDAILAV